MCCECVRVMCGCVRIRMWIRVRHQMCVRVWVWLFACVWVGVLVCVFACVWLYMHMFM